VREGKVRVPPGKERCWGQAPAGRGPRSEARRALPAAGPAAPPRRRGRKERGRLRLLLRAASQPAEHCGGAAPRVRARPRPGVGGRQWEKVPPCCCWPKPPHMPLSSVVPWLPLLLCLLCDTPFHFLVALGERMLEREVARDPCQTNTSGSTSHRCFLCHVSLMELA